MHAALLELVRQKPVVEKHNGFLVVREDLVSGGSKMRFLPYLVEPYSELVFGGPFCGGAPLALSEIGKRTGQKVTLFYAARANLHPRQIKARENGAKLKLVRPGYLTVVQSRARAYAKKKGAHFLELGFDMPEAQAPFLAFMAKVRKKAGDPPEVWCAAGSGFLARCLGLAFPDSEIKAVAVGLASRHTKQAYSSNVTILECGYDFDEATKFVSPFQSCPNYDRKAWEMMQSEGVPGALMWNVL